MTRVLVLDDHDVLRRGLNELLEDSGDIEVVGEAGTAVEARSRIPLAEPDVAVLDVRLSDGSGVEICRHGRCRFRTGRCGRHVGGRCHGDSVRGHASRTHALPCALRHLRAGAVGARLPVRY